MRIKRFTFMLTILVFIITSPTHVKAARNINLVQSNTIENTLSRFLSTKVIIDGNEYVFQPRQQLQGNWGSQLNDKLLEDNNSVSVVLDFTRDGVEQKRYIFNNTRFYNPNTLIILPDLLEDLNLQFEGYNLSIDGNSKIDIDTVNDKYGNIYVLQGLLNRLGYYNRTTSDGNGLIVYTDTHIFLFKANSAFYAIVPIATSDNMLFHNVLSTSSIENNTIFSVETSNAPVLKFNDLFLLPLEIINTIIQFSSDHYIENLGVVIDKANTSISINTYDLLKGNINNGVLPQYDLYLSYIEEVMMYLEFTGSTIDVEVLVNNYYVNNDFNDVFYNIYHTQTNFNDWVYVHEYTKVTAWNENAEDIDVVNLENVRLQLKGINSIGWTPYFNDANGNYYFFEGPFKFINSSGRLVSFPTWKIEN